eukprot:GHVR01167556.1.p2 GENE.GHVR01167556.1~~GHVR01167556.1.p2  ORF type:complete len:189 (+),score=30.96 GHVR01167556.1:754-1320(+)
MISLRNAPANNPQGADIERPIGHRVYTPGDLVKYAYAGLRGCSPRYDLDFTPITKMEVKQCQASLDFMYSIKSRLSKRKSIKPKGVNEEHLRMSRMSSLAAELLHSVREELGTSVALPAEVDVDDQTPENNTDEFLQKVRDAQTLLSNPSAMTKPGHDGIILNYIVFVINILLYNIFVFLLLNNFVII